MQKYIQISHKVVEAVQFFKDKKPWPEQVVERNGRPYLIRKQSNWTKLDDGDWIVYTDFDHYALFYKQFEKHFIPMDNPEGYFERLLKMDHETLIKHIKSVGEDPDELVKSFNEAATRAIKQV